MQPQLNVLAELRTLAALRAAGVLTQGEYEATRAQLRVRLDDEGDSAA